LFCHSLITFIMVFYINNLKINHLQMDNMWLVISMLCLMNVEITS